MTRKPQPIEITDHQICLQPAHRIIGHSIKYIRATGAQRMYLYDNDYRLIINLLEQSGFNTSAGITVLGAPIISGGKK